VSVDDHGAATQLLPQSRGGGVGIFRKNRRKITFHIGLVHARVGANVAQECFRDQDAAIHFQDSLGLRQNEFD